MEVLDLRKQWADAKGQLERLRLDADYLKARASKPKPKPRLSYVKALSLTIADE
jgi:hypothetical protein